MLRGYPLGEVELATLATNLNEVRAVSLTRVLPNEVDLVGSMPFRVEREGFS